MEKIRLFIIVGAVLVLSGLVYGVTSVSIGKENATEKAWKVRCEESKDGSKKFCEAYAALYVKENGARLVEFVVGYPANSEGKARGAVTLPLGMLLPPGGTLKVDDGQVYTYAMQTCSAKGCHALIDMKDDVLKEFRAGKKLILSFSLNGKRLNFELPLGGFSDAIDDLK